MIGLLVVPIPMVSLATGSVITLVSNTLVSTSPRLKLTGSMSTVSPVARSTVIDNRTSLEGAFCTKVS